MHKCSIAYYTYATHPQGGESTLIWAERCPFLPGALLPFRGVTRTPPWTPALAMSLLQGDTFQSTIKPIVQLWNSFCFNQPGEQHKDFISDPINLHWHLVEIVRPECRSHPAGWDLHPPCVLLDTLAAAAGLPKAPAGVSAVKTRPCNPRSHHSPSTNIVLLSDPHKPH